MVELFNASVSLINLPFTVLLTLILLYWVGVIIGAADMELFHTDIMGDMDMDMDDPGIGHAFLNFLNIGEVPVMIIVSIMILCGWCFSIISNYYLNPGQSYLLTFGLLVPNIIVSLFISSLATKPMRKLFQTLNKESDTQAGVLFKSGVVVTSEVTPSFGQVEIKTDGAPITINVRTKDDLLLKKGESVVIYDEDKEKGIYFVEKFNE